MNINGLLMQGANYLGVLTPKIVMGLIILIGFWIVAVIIDKMIILVGRKSRVHNDVFYLLARLSRIGLVIVGLITALGTMGMNVSALVASLGLTGFALGFALKDALSNILAGVLILLYQPFEVGSVIKVMGYEGEVVKIDLRYTTIKTFARDVLLPNASLFNNPVEIVSKS